MVKIAALSNPGSKLINNLILQGLHFQQVVFRWAHPHGGARENCDETAGYVMVRKRLIFAVNRDRSKRDARPASGLWPAVQQGVYYDT